MLYKTLDNNNPYLQTAGLQGVVHYRGSLPTSRIPILGVVGTRKITPFGHQALRDLLEPVLGPHMMCASGLALGSDARAHTLSIRSNCPTIAVLPCGINNVYPASNTKLAFSILESGGCLLSQFKPNDGPAKYRFIERNRLIATISDVLLVSEAPNKSGALYTAKFALEMGKPVLVFLADYNRYYSQGSNALLKIGAQPVINPKDINDALGLKTEDNRMHKNLTSIQKSILEISAENQCALNQLEANLNIEFNEILKNVSELELMGLIRVSNGIIYRSPDSS